MPGMASASKEPPDGAEASPASPLTPRRIIRRLAVPKLSPSLELNTLLDSQVIEEPEVSTSQLLPAGRLDAPAEHESKTWVSPTTNTKDGVKGSAGVKGRQALTPSKRQNQSSPGGAHQGKTGRVGKLERREAFAAVKKLAGSLAKRALIGGAENAEGSEEGAANETRDGQRRISSYFAPSLKRGTLQFGKSSEMAEVAGSGWESATEEREVEERRGEGQVAVVPEEELAARQGRETEERLAEPEADGAFQGAAGHSFDCGVLKDCQHRGELGSGVRANAALNTSADLIRVRESALGEIDAENAAGESPCQEVGVPMGRLLEGAQDSKHGGGFARGLQPCIEALENGERHCEDRGGAALLSVVEVDPMAIDASRPDPTAMESEAQVVGAASPKFGSTGSLKSVMQEGMPVQPVSETAPLISTPEGTKVEPSAVPLRQERTSEPLASEPLPSCCPETDTTATKAQHQAERCDNLPCFDSASLASCHQKQSLETTGNPELLPVVASDLTIVPTPNLNPAMLSGLTSDAIDEMCEALLADIEDLPTTVPFLTNPSEPFHNHARTQDLGPKIAFSGSPHKPGNIPHESLHDSSKPSPNQPDIMLPLNPITDVLITERTVEQTVITEVSTSEGLAEKQLAERQWRRRMGERRRRGRMAVTDVCALEWCEMQVDFGTRVGKPAPTPVMQAGTARHEQLEREVITRVEVPVATREDAWALKLLNMITGLRQLAREGMTRELYILGCLEGHWIVGIIDELRLVERGGAQRTLLCDTKTRKTLKPPSDAQKRTGMLQLMCYKLLFDGLLSARPFPVAAFFAHFALDARAPLSADVIEHAAAECGLHVAALEDVVGGLAAECRETAPAHDTLLLRYEWQERRTVWAEDEFDAHPDWARERIAWHLDYWFGRRGPEVVPENERWKCRFCAFRDACETGKSLTSETGSARAADIELP